jgi:hypothetical protein
MDMESPEEGLDLGFLGSLAEARRTSQRKESTRGVITMSIKVLVERVH